MPDIVVLADEPVPVLYQRDVVGSHVGKWAAVDRQDAGVAEMRVAREEDHCSGPDLGAYVGDAISSCRPVT
ncbi:UNVERIFIED_ORG: hypothetical protein M2435_006395 [Rhizobium sophorae]|nr:hypothetical protein [Rhizobium sophorae]